VVNKFNYQSKPRLKLLQQVTICERSLVKKIAINLQYKTKPEEHKTAIYLQFKVNSKKKCDSRNLQRLTKYDHSHRNFLYSEQKNNFFRNFVVVYLRYDGEGLQLCDRGSQPTLKEFSEFAGHT
jgi:hypothetical protein